MKSFIISGPGFVVCDNLLSYQQSWIELVANLEDRFSCNEA